MKVKGSIVTNPAYALENNNAPVGPARESLRRGTIMFNGRVMKDRPLMFELRDAAAKQCPCGRAPNR